MPSNPIARNQNRKIDGYGQIRYQTQRHEKIFNTKKRRNAGTQRDGRKANQERQGDNRKQKDEKKKKETKKRSKQAQHRSVETRVYVETYNNIHLVRLKRTKKSFSINKIKQRVKHAHKNTPHNYRVLAGVGSGVVRQGAGDRTCGGEELPRGVPLDALGPAVVVGQRQGSVVVVPADDPDARLLAARGAVRGVR